MDGRGYRTELCTSHMGRPYTGGPNLLNPNPSQTSFHYSKDGGGRRSAAVGVPVELVTSRTPLRSAPFPTFHGFQRGTSGPLAGVPVALPSFIANVAVFHGVAF